MTGDTEGWLMDDPEVAFPVFERAQELGIKVVAIHEATPVVLHLHAAERTAR